MNAFSGAQKSIQWFKKNKMLRSRRTASVASQKKYLCEHCYFHPVQKILLPSVVLKSKLSSSEEALKMLSPKAPIAFQKNIKRKLLRKDYCFQWWCSRVLQKKKMLRPEKQHQ